MSELDGVGQLVAAPLAAQDPVARLQQDAGPGAHYGAIVMNDEDGSLQLSHDGGFFDTQLGHTTSSKY